MKLKLTYYLTPDVNPKSIQDLSEKLEFFFKDKSYGNDISSIYIGISCVDPKFDKFFKPRKPMYTSEKKTYMKEGINFEIEKTLEYDIKINYEQYKTLDEKLLKKEIALNILDSIRDLTEIKRIAKLEFDFKQFSNELDDFVKLGKYI